MYRRLSAIRLLLSSLPAMAQDNLGPRLQQLVQGNAVTDAPGLTYHGLRNTIGKLVLEAGGAKEDVAMILGDRSEAMGAFYSRE